VLKAVAEQRGWEHHRHRHYHKAANRLGSETGDAGIRRFFNSSSALHENFYEDDMVPESLDDAGDLLAKLTSLLTQT